MIRLFREPLPDGVSVWLTTQQQKFDEARAAGQTVTDYLLSAYRVPDVKVVLLAETHGKCAYCECQFTHSFFGDVDHILPKDQFPQQRLVHHNLTVTCSICNNLKSNYHSADCPLLNPYSDDPADHLIAAGPMVHYRPGSDRGQITQMKLKLNRIDLVERRIEWLDGLLLLIDAINRASTPGRKAVLTQELLERAGVDKAYTMVSRQFVAQHGFDLGRTGG